MDFWDENDLSDWNTIYAPDQKLKMTVKEQPGPLKRFTKHITTPYPE
jgi:hypothetical protein